MKRILIVAAFLFATTDQIFAADLPIPPSQASAGYFPAVQPINWGGFYGGVNGGYGFGSSSWTGTGVSTGAFGASGGLAGGTLGLNLDTDGLVLGFEADADWADIKGGSSNTYCSSATAGAVCETKNNFLATGRVRLGYAFNRVLLYGTGGAAFGNIQTGYAPPSTFDSTNNVGWTAGLGVEVAFTKFWSAKIEYLYVDLGNVSCGSNCGAGAPVTATLTENIVRAGVNFRFGPW